MATCFDRNGKEIICVKTKHKINTILKTRLSKDKQKNNDIIKYKLSKESIHCSDWKFHVNWKKLEWVVPRKINNPQKSVNR